MHNNSIVVQANSLENLATHFGREASNYSQAVIISSPALFALYENLVLSQLNALQLFTTPILVPDGEQAKTMLEVEKCWDKMSNLQLDRKSLVIALGGGSITDLAGFVASTYMRGIDTLYIPTTLMAMIDASIGGKTGINFRNRKNLIGSFHLPKKVIIDPNCLKTISKREFSSGLAEIIKYGMIGSIDLFELLENKMNVIRHDMNSQLVLNIIRQCCNIKSEIVSQDPTDLDIRAILNYGHTFGHAIEDLTEYRQFSHGEAVSIGMNCAAYLSYSMGKLEWNVVQRQEQLCKAAGLPTNLPTSISIDQLIDKMREDKKAVQGTINLILPERIGKVSRFNNIDPKVLREAFSNLQPLR